MMLLRRSVTAVLSPLKQVAAVRSFTATVAIKLDEQTDGTPEPMIYEGMQNDYVEIQKQLRSLNKCLTDLQERMDDKILDDEQSDFKVKITNKDGIDVQHLGAMIQKEGMKMRSTIQEEGIQTRSRIQDEENKNRLIDAIWKLDTRKTTHYHDDNNGTYLGPQTKVGTDERFPFLLRSILRAFLAGEGFDVSKFWDKVGIKRYSVLKKKDNLSRHENQEFAQLVRDTPEMGKSHELHYRETLIVAIADLTGTTPQYKANADNRFMIYHG